jgi:sedoheptulokinase
MFAAGIDVGTTNLGLSLLDLETAKVVERRSAPNPRVLSTDEYAFFQDAAGIVAAVKAMAASLKQPIGSIGVTGQVHGIVYTDGAGNPLSPLYNWLDRHGMEPVGGKTPQALLAEKTGVLLPPGYGLLTHYANTLAGRVPPGACRITGINELVAGAFLGKPLDKTDASGLACFGGYDPVSESHNPRVLEEVLSPEFRFLGLARPFTLAGTGPGGVPVAYPVGDNQAGFFGMVSRPEISCLISIGTSGQISVYSASENCPRTMELRPYLGLGYLHVGATLCAGKAYEVLARFFREIIDRFCSRSGLPPAGEEAVFDLMKEAAREPASSVTSMAASLTVDTAINGTRLDPERRGAVSGITLDNLTMGNAVRGCVDGIVRELEDFRRDMGPVFDPVKSIVVSGSAVRKNSLFREALERHFNMEIRVPGFDGGAALGAALIGAAAAGHIELKDTAGIIDTLWETGSDE